MRKTILFIFTLLLLPHFAWADELLWSPNDTGSSTSRLIPLPANLGIDGYRSSVTFDCVQRGWGSINSIWFGVFTTSATQNMLVRANGKQADYVVAITTTPNVNASSTWATPVYCGDDAHRTVTFDFIYNSGSGAGRMYGDIRTGSAQDMDLRGVWSSYSGPAPAGGGVAGTFMPQLFIRGEYATATPSAGSSTTTYNFYTATTSPAESIEKFTLVFFVFALCIVMAIGFVFAYNLLIWKRR